jgi:hypothetical protein
MTFRDVFRHDVCAFVALLAHQRHGIKVLQTLIGKRADD